MNVNRQDLRHWLEVADFSSILDLARNSKGILSRLTARSYDPDPQVAERAIQATGLSAKNIAQRDPEFVRNYLLRLFWLVNHESGSIGWRAPELIGEILYHCPEFDQFFPLLISLLHLEQEDAPRFLAGTLWAIGWVAQSSQAAMLPASSQVQSILKREEFSDTEIRKQTRWCLDQLTSGWKGKS